MAGPRYNLIDDHLPQKPRDDDERAKIREISYAPYWVLAVVRLPMPSSALRSYLTDAGRESVSASTNPADGVRRTDVIRDGGRLTKRPVMVLTGSVAAMSVSSPKGPQSMMSSTLFPTREWRSAILPGDWVLAWITNSETKGRQLVDRIRRLEPCNAWDDGLRFVGRVDQGPIRDRSRSADGGLTATYSMNCSGFSELQTKVFYDPHLAESSKTMGSWLAKAGAAITELLNDPSKDGASRAAIDINRVMHVFMDLWVGSGVPRRFSNPDSQTFNAPQLRIQTGGTASDSHEAPYALLCPEAVGRLLGKTSASKTAILAYADILELVTGIQRFSGGGSDPWVAMAPDGLDPPPQGESVTPHRRTSYPMLGLFIPQMSDFSNKPLWTILEQWLNPTINEMYCCLKSNEAGRVVPMLTVRQMPFSTEAMTRALAQKQVVATPFLEVPRWVLHPAMIYQDRSGRNNQTRFNFIHIGGQTPMLMKNTSQTSQLINSPPIRDDLDVQRSGLRPYMTTVACSPEEAVNGPRRWAELCSDWLLGQHLMLTGSSSMCGVQAPMPPGDNIEFDGEVYHIESRSDECGIDSSGVRHWGTSVQLTHGVRSDGSPIYQNHDAKSDAYLYAGLRQDDAGSYGPWVSADPEEVEVEDLG